MTQYIYAFVKMEFTDNYDETAWKFVEEDMGAVWPEGMRFGFNITNGTNLPEVYFFTQDENEVTMNGVDISKTNTFEVSLHKGNLIRYLPKNNAAVYNLVITTEEFLQTVKAEIFVRQTGERFLLTQTEVSVGRIESCDIVLKDIAGLHLIIALVEEGFKVTSNNNRGFTYLNTDEYFGPDATDDNREYLYLDESTVVSDGHEVCIHEKDKIQYTISMVKFDATKVTIASVHSKAPPAGTSTTAKRPRDADGDADADKDGKQPALGY